MGIIHNVGRKTGETGLVRHVCLRKELRVIW